MKLELYYYEACGFSQSVLNTIKNLKIQEKVDFKNIRENSEFEKELVIACGDSKVPTLIVDGKTMRESEDIKTFLVQQFM